MYNSKIKYITRCMRDKRLFGHSYLCDLCNYSSLKEGESVNEYYFRYPEFKSYLNRERTTARC